MSCLLTQGFTRDCRDQVGGLKAVYLANWSEITDFTEANGEVSAMTLTSGSFFHKYEPRKSTSSFTETYTVDEQTGTAFHEQEVTVVLSKLEAAKRNEIYLLAQTDVVVIAEDRNNNYVVLGLDEGLVLGGSGQSGTEYGDIPGYELTFTGQEKNPSRFTTEGVVTGSLAP